MLCGISHFPCGNTKFRVELGNSRRKSRIPIGILKFCVESENATRNFAIPCGNPKFRVEIENSRRKSQIPIGILKFCAEFQKAKRNLAIPCRNRKFRVEFENSHAELRNSDRNFHRHRYSKRFSAACWTARLLTSAAYCCGASAGCVIETPNIR